MKFPCILLSAQGVDYTNDKDGSSVNGTTIFYITTDDLSPLNNEESNSKGHKVSRAWLSSKLASRIENAPAIYDMTFDLVSNSKLKNELRVRDLQYVGDIKVDLC